MFNDRDCTNVCIATLIGTIPVGPGRSTFNYQPSGMFNIQPFSPKLLNLQQPRGVVPRPRGTKGGTVRTHLRWSKNLAEKPIYDASKIRQKNIFSKFYLLLLFFIVYYFLMFLAIWSYDGSNICQKKLGVFRPR